MRVLALALLLAGCASGPRSYDFPAQEVRKATKLLNRLGAEAKPQVEEACTPLSAELRAFCRALRSLYKGVLLLADGIDEAMNTADAQNQAAVDINKVLEAGFRLLELATETEAPAATVRREESRP